ncbi:MAG: methyltransferase domain-containing protein [Boseongicola sp.]|nr:MAG: methyltransferase domain-containing protein [Boseongicola sp.]
MQSKFMELATSANALIAIGLALKVKLQAEPDDPALMDQVAQVVDALGLTKSMEALTKPQAATMLANIRGDLLLGVRVLCDDKTTSEWEHDQAELLQTFGEVSAGFPKVLKSKIGPELYGLLERLEKPGARFLDIGTGVAELSIAMVRQWPSLEVLGIEPWEPSLAIGFRNVTEAGLEEKIELRKSRAEALTEFDAFDLAWVPSAFIPSHSLPSVLERVSNALKAGGWLLLARPHHDSEPLARATAHFRTVLWGGGPLSCEDAEEHLNKAGLHDVRSVSMPPGAPIAVTIGRCK